MVGKLSAFPGIPKIRQKARKKINCTWKSKGLSSVTVLRHFSCMISCNGIFFSICKLVMVKMLTKFLLRNSYSYFLCVIQRASLSFSSALQLKNFRSYPWQNVLILSTRKTGNSRKDATNKFSRCKRLPYFPSRKDHCNSMSSF